MSTRDPEAIRRAVERLAALLADARAGAGALAATGREAAAIREAIDELRMLDPALQRRIARAMLESKGDPAALLAVLDGVDSAGDVTEPVASREVRLRRRAGGAHPPTVVDARGGGSRLVIPFALLCAALAAAWFAQ